MTQTSTPTQGNKGNSNKGKRPMTFDHLKSLKKPQTVSVHIALDSDLAQEFEEARQAVEIARMIADENGAEAANLKETTKKFDDLKERVNKESVKFTFRAMGRKRYDALVNEHPPTEEQREKAKENEDDPDDLQWNPETFPQALAAKSIVDPEMTEDQFMEMWDSDDWSGPELLTMFWAALQANTVRGVVNLGKD